MRLSYATKVWCLGGIAGGILCLAAGGAAWANAKVYDRALCSTGWVIVPREKNTTSGTCWLADRQRRLVVTSLHITDDCREVLVYFPARINGELVVEAGHYVRKTAPINGRVVATDKLRDLAIIQIESVPAGVTEFPLAEASCRPGEDIHSIGNSGFAGDLSNGTLWRYTRGNVRQVYPKKISSPEGVRQVRLVETQSPVNNGDSGSPLVNDGGQLIGVACAYRADEQLVSYNIDVAEIKTVLREATSTLDKVPAAKEQPRGETDRLASSLVGAWSITVEGEEGAPLSGVAQFKTSGAFDLSPGSKDHKGLEGRYTYANDILWLITDKALISLKLTWADKNQFRSRSGEADWVFERRKPE